MESQYCVGQFVKVNNKQDRPIIGEIVEVIKDSLRLNIFLHPEDTHTGRHPYNAKSELYQALPIQQTTVQVSQVISKCEIVDLTTYQNYLFEQQEKNLDGVYVQRQIYDLNNKKFSPSIPLICFCKQPLNPDVKLISCSMCNTMYHNDCLQLTKKESCQCGNLFGEYSSKKRKLDSSGKYIPSSIQKKQSNNSKKEISKYSKYSIKEDAVKRLEDIDNKLTFQRETLNQTSSKEGVKRQQIIDNFQMSMELAIEELYEQGKNQQIQVKNSARDLAIEIESNVFIQFNEKTDQLYMKKCRTLHSNLSDPQNQELRLQVIMGQLIPSELVNLSVQDLAPSSLKKLRFEREAQYLKNHMVQENTVIMLKTHKGEHVIEIDHSQLMRVKQENIKSTLDQDAAKKRESEGQSELGAENEKINQMSVSAGESNDKTLQQNQNQSNQKSEESEQSKIHEANEQINKIFAQQQDLNFQESNSIVQAQNKTIISAPSGRKKIMNQINIENSVLKAPIDNSKDIQMLYQECKQVTQISLSEKIRMRVKQNLEYQQQKQNEQLLHKQLECIRQAMSKFTEIKKVQQ